MPQCCRSYAPNAVRGQFRCLIVASEADVARSAAMSANDPLRTSSILFFCNAQVLSNNFWIWRILLIPTLRSPIGHRRPHHVVGGGDDVWSGYLRLASLRLFNLIDNRVLQQRRIKILFGMALSKPQLKAARPKSEHFSVPRRNYVFSCARDISGCTCRLPNSGRDCARQIRFFDPVRVLVGRSRSVQAQSPTPAHKI